MTMVRYLTLLRFTEQGSKNVRKSIARAEEFRKAAAKIGVTVEAQNWTTGSYDGALVFSADDENNAMRCLAALAAAGNVRTETLRVFNAREFEAILGK